MAYPDGKCGCYLRYLPQGAGRWHVLPTAGRWALRARNPQEGRLDSRIPDSLGRVGMSPPCGQTRREGGRPAAGMPALRKGILPFLRVMARQRASRRDADPEGGQFHVPAPSQRAAGALPLGGASGWGRAPAKRRQWR